MVRDTVVLHGRGARSRGRLLQGLAVFALAVPPWIVVPSWQLVSRLEDAQARCFARRNELHTEIERDWHKEVRAVVTAARPDLARLA